MPKYRRGTQIVVIDDNPSEAKLLLYSLRKKGLEKVIHFDTGKEALQWLFGEAPYVQRKSDTNPRLILLDINMPQMSGIDVLKAIRAHEGTSTIPVVMLTSSAEDSDLKMAYANGANGYVQKPVIYEDFTVIVEKLNGFWNDANIPPVGSS